MTPYLIGIAGPSCAGKTVIAARLAEALPGRAATVSLDSYYRDLSSLPPETREQHNFDAPDALDAELVERQLADLAAGRPVRRPVYDFATHTRSESAERVEPADYVLVEGLFVLYWERVRRLLNLKIFVCASDDVCLGRRQRRDVSERGRSAESVTAQYEQTVKPMREQYIEPTTAFADVVVGGSEPLESSVKLLADWVLGRTAG